MPTSPEEALATARAYVREHRQDCRVGWLLEDEQDYFVRLVLAPGFTVWQLNGTWVFVSKATGRPREECCGNVLEKVDRMTPVAGS